MKNVKENKMEYNLIVETCSGKFCSEDQDMSLSVWSFMQTSVTKNLHILGY